MKNKSILFYIIFAVILICPFMLGTEPSIPFQEYRVAGNIGRQSGGPKQNYIVSLLGRSRLMPDRIIPLHSSSGLDYSVTDTSGYFFVDVFSQEVDSITIVVTGADKPQFVSSTWLAPSATITLYDESTSKEAGCSGCGTEVNTVTYVKGYLHTFQNQIVVIPD
jgi:hypothetical protein